MIIAIIVFFLIIMLLGIAAAAAKNIENSGENKDEGKSELPRVVVTQQVPSVFDTIKRK